MATIALPSVQSLLLEMQVNGQPLSTGTGFVVNTGKGAYLITNRHNVTGRHQDTNAPLSKSGGIPDRIGVIHNKKGSLGNWVPRFEPLYVGSTPRWVEHPSLGAKADIVALQLTDLADVELYPYDPANPGPAIQLGPADAVSVVGFPFGITAGGALAVWATGFLASDPDIDFNALPIQLIDCRSRQGQSGSPVIAYRSGGALGMTDGSSAIFTGTVTKFIGVYSGRINNESDLGIVWKATALVQLINAL